jgi:hypothetical protein
MKDDSSKMYANARNMYNQKSAFRMDGCSDWPWAFPTYDCITKLCRCSKRDSITTDPKEWQMLQGK